MAESRKEEDPGFGTVSPDSLALAANRPAIRIEGISEVHGLNAIKAGAALPYRRHARWWPERSLNFAPVVLSKVSQDTDLKLPFGKTVLGLKFLHRQLRLAPKIHRSTEYMLSPAP